jgi:hypothetical protein
MSTKITIPKCNIKNVDNKVVQANFIKAVSDLVTAENAKTSAKQALVDVTLELIGSATELTYDDRMFIRDMLVLGYQAKYSDESIALDRATKQFGDVRKVLVEKHNIVFLDKETKVAKDKAKSRGVKKEVTVNRVDRVKQIRKNNPKLSNADAVIQLNKNIVDASGTALSETQQKDLLKAVEDEEFNLSAKRELLKIIKPRFIFDKDHQDELKDLDINLLIEVEQLSRKLRKA